MKKFILSALLIGSAAAGAYAQAGSVLVYGNIGFHSSKDASDNKTRSFNINPGIGYQFDKHWTVGLAGGFETTRFRPNNATEWNFGNQYNAGVFVRHTMPFGKIFAIFHQLEAGYQGTSTGNTGNNTTLNANGFYARFTPAVGVNIVDGFALNFGFGGIEFSTMKASGADKAVTSFDLTLGNQFNIGVSKNILCGKHRRHGKRHHMMMNHGSRMEKAEIEEDKVEVEEKD